MTWDELISEITRLALEHGGQPNVERVQMTAEGLHIIYPEEL